MLKFTRDSVCGLVARRARFFGAVMVLAVVAPLAMPGGALAQGGGGGGGPASSAREQAMRDAGMIVQRDQQVAEEARFDLRFEGGTVADYLEAIQEASGKRNIVAMAGTDTVPMPPVALDDVNTQAAVWVLNGLSVEEEDGSRRSISFFTQFDVVTVSVSLRTDRNLMRSPVVRPPVSRGTAVHGLAGLLAEEVYTVDAILSAIEVALEMAGDSEAVLRYHEETRMLFVHGTGAEHATVRSVLEELSLQAELMPIEEKSDAEWIEEDIAAVDGMIEDAERGLLAWEGDELRRVKQEIETLRAEIVELEKQIMDGVARPMSEDEIAMKYRALERAMVEQEEIETRMRNTRIEREELITRRAQLQAELERLRQP